MAVGSGFSRLGWQIREYDDFDRYGLMHLADRMVHICIYMIRNEKSRFYKLDKDLNPIAEELEADSRDREVLGYRFRLAESLSTERFSECASIISGRQKEFWPLLNREDPTELYQKVIAFRDLRAMSKRAISWAKVQDLEAALAKWCEMPTGMPGDLPLLHLSALAVRGDADVLRRYQSGFEQGNRLGFVPGVKKEHIDRALALAEQSVKKGVWGSRQAPVSLSTSVGRFIQSLRAAGYGRASGGRSDRESESVSELQRQSALVDTGVRCLSNGTSLLRQKEVPAVFERLGWTVERYGSHCHAFMQLSDRVVRVVPQVALLPGCCESLSLLKAVSTESFCDAVAKIGGSGNGFRYISQSGQWLRISRQELTYADVREASEQVIEWALELDLERELSRMRKKPRKPLQWGPVEHFAALALHGDVDRLRHYQLNYDKPVEELGFIPHVTKETIDRAVELASRQTSG